jgi:hypothetical protein
MAAGLVNLLGQKSRSASLAYHLVVKSAKFALSTPKTLSYEHSPRVVSPWEQVRVRGVQPPYMTVTHIGKENNPRSK